MKKQALKNCTRAILPVQDTIEVLNGKWKLAILGILTDGGQRFSQLQRTITGITPRMLSKELKELEKHGLVTRTCHDKVPAITIYQLTPYAYTLKNVLTALRDWGLHHRQRMFAKS